MSLSEIVVSQLRAKLNEYNRDYNIAEKTLKDFLSKEEPLIFLFGKGFAPDNPATLIDLIVLTKKFILSIDITSDHLSYSFFKLSDILQVAISIFNDHVRFQITIGGLGTGIYINSDLTEVENVQRFTALIRENIQ